MKAATVAFLAFFSCVANGSGIAIRDAYIPMLPPFSKTYAAYLTISNLDAHDRTVVAVSAEGFAMAHIHQSLHKDDIASMAALAELKIPASETVTMAPGGIHMMLMNRLVDLAKVGSVVIVLTFSDGEVAEVEAVLREID